MAHLRTGTNLHEVWTHFLADIMAIADHDNSATIQWIHLRFFLTFRYTFEVWGKTLKTSLRDVSGALPRETWLILS